MAIIQIGDSHCFWNTILSLRKGLYFYRPAKSIFGKFVLDIV